MATMQVQKTRTKQTTTDTVMTQKQSLEIVQTLLLGGLSSLTYMRDFFPEKAFDTQFYENNGRIPSYKDYANCKLPPKKGTAQGTMMRVLRRHRSKRADKFLDWLEKGAFSALKQENLHALQICVHLNADDREQVVETYTFTIKYHTDQNSGQNLASLEFGGSAGAPVTVQATSEDMQKMVRGIAQLTERLPSLPDERYVSMALFYVPNGKKPYQPHGFEPSITNELRFAKANGWEKRTTKLDTEVHSAFHSATLKVSYIHDPDLEAVSNLVPSSYPAKLTHGNAIAAHADIDISVPQETDAETVVSQTPMQRRNSTTSTIDQADPSIGRLFDQMATPVPTSAVSANNKFVNSPVLSEVDVNTQSSVVPRMKTALNGMMHPEHWTQGDTQTQMSMRPPPPVNRLLSRVTSRISTSPVHVATSTGEVPLGQQPWASDQMVMLPKFAKELAVRMPELQETALKLADTAASRTTNGDIVLCQCGHGNDEQDTIYCSCCGTWQHLHCYGYSGASDPRLPEDHTCYQCLLGDRDEETLTKLKDLCIQRRGMAVVLQKGLHRKAELAKNMGIDARTASTLHAQLHKYVVNAQNSHKPGFAATGKAPWVPAQPGHPNYDRMLRELFDPVTHVEKYYATRPPLTEPIRQQLQALRSASMPPPSTPASVFNKNRNSATPGDGLDIRASMSPYTTPVRMPTGKRARELEEDGESETPAKRHASETPFHERLRSVQSSYILNADGKSSSPAGRH